MAKDGQSRPKCGNRGNQWQPKVTGSERDYTEIVTMKLLTGRDISLKLKTLEADKLYMLETEFNYYKAHQKELAQQFHGKFLLIRDTEILGSFDSELDAYTDAKKRGLALGSFLIQLCQDAQEDQPQVFHSRVSF